MGRAVGHEPVVAASVGTPAAYSRSWLKPCRLERLCVEIVSG